MTGLTAGRELVRNGHVVDVYEATDSVGGLAKTFIDDEGFVYDNGPRFIFSTLAEKIGIADQCEPVKYYENLYIKGRYYQFPFGFVKNPFYCLSAGLAMLTRALRPRPKNLASFLSVYYGRIFSSDVLRPLIEKWSGVPATEMSTDFASRLLPTNLNYIIHSLIKKLRGGVTEDYYKKGRYIVYPRTSNRAIFDKLCATPGLNVHLNAKLEKLKFDGALVSSAVVGGKSLQADFFISTIPIHDLANLFPNEPTSSNWKGLRYRGILILFIKLQKEKIIDPLWSWFPEPKYRFYRISEFKNALPNLAPEGKTLLAVEMACETDHSDWRKSASALFDDIYDDLKELYGLERKDVIGLDLKRSAHAYPVLKKSTEEIQRALTHKTPFKNLFIAGRTGNFQYRMLEGSYESAMTCVQTILHQISGTSDATSKSAVARDAYGRPLIVPE